MTQIDPLGIATFQIDPHLQLSLNGILFQGPHAFQFTLHIMGCQNFPSNREPRKFYAI